MVKRRRETEPDDSNEETTLFGTVFIDTSLDTHLAMIVASSDTVSDFKKKIVLEHVKCFPEIGEIQIQSLKVKRRGNFYCLPDVMLVWSAFQVVKGNWFLLADASGTPACRLKITSEHGTSNGEKMDLMALDDEGLSSDIKRLHTFAMSSPDGVAGKSSAPGGLMAYKSLEKTADFQRINYSDENVVETEPRAKKKRKMTHKEDVHHNTNLKDNNALIPLSFQNISKSKTSIVDAMREGQEGMVQYEQQWKPTMPEAIGKVSGVVNDEHCSRNRIAFKGTSVPATEEKSTLESNLNSEKQDKRKEDSILESITPEIVMASKLESRLGENAPTDHQGAVAVKVPNLSTMPVDASDAMRDANSDGKKRKKKKAKGTRGAIQDASDIEQTGKAEDIKRGTEALNSEEQEGEKEVHQDHDHELTKASCGKPSDEASPDLALDKTIFSQKITDANVVMEPEITSGTTTKKKRKVKKYAETDMEKSRMDLTNNGISGALDGTDKRESIMNHKQKEEQMKVLDSSAADAIEEVRNANRNVADFAASGQTKQTDANVVMEPEITNGTTKKKKRKVKKYAETNMEKSSMEQTDNGISGALDETDRREIIPSHKQKDVEMKLLDSSAADASEEVRNANRNVADFVVLSQTEQTDANFLTEPEIASGTTKKKRRVKRYAETDIEKSGMEQTDNGISGTLDETKRESILNHDVQMKLLNSSAADASEEVRIAYRNVADFVTSRQAEQTVEDVSIDKEMRKKAKSAADSHQLDFLAPEKENQILEFNKEVNNSENTENKDKKTKRKSKGKLTASDGQEKLPIKDQKVGLEVLTTDNLNCSVKSQQEPGHVTSSQALSHKNEKELEEMHVTALNKGDGINFKQYFLASQDQDKVDSGEKVKKATKSNAEKKSRKKVKGHGLPSVSISTELQSSLKSFQNQESESKSRIRQASGDSALNSDRGEVNPTSIKRALTVSGNGVKDSSPSDKGEITTLQKPNVKESNTSLYKSSSERSETVPKFQGNEKLPLSLSVTNKMVMKTPLKISLLSKPGSIFVDNSGESSSDENGKLHFDASVRTPPDSPSDSSSSGNSLGESDLSQGSDRNGSNDVKGRSAGGKSMSKLDLSASKDLTMDVILRSSKRFKKAKLLVSKNEVEQLQIQDMEFVPDSEPNP